MIHIPTQNHFTSIIYGVLAMIEADAFHFNMAEHDMAWDNKM
jgi:hypothetical protein